ncbi:hypothetical protein ACT2CC_00490 [Candidatus Vidania fulgoroideorum]
MKATFSTIKSLIFIKDYIFLKEILNIEGNETEFNLDLYNIKLLYNNKKNFFIKSFFENLCIHNIVYKIENHFVYKKNSYLTKRYFIFVTKKVWSSILIESFLLRLKNKYGIIIYKKKFKTYIFFYHKKINNFRYLNLLLKEIYIYFNKIIVLNFNMNFYFNKQKKIHIKICEKFLRKIYYYKKFDDFFLLNIDKRIFFLLKKNSFKFKKTFLEFYNKICCLNNYLKNKNNICIKKSNFKNDLIDILLNKDYELFYTSSFTKNKKKNSIEILSSKCKYLRTNLRNELIKKYYKKKKFFEIGFIFKKKKNNIIQKKRLCIICNTNRTKIYQYSKDISFILEFFNIELKDKIFLTKLNKKCGVLGKINYNNNILLYLEIDLKQSLYNYIFNNKKYIKVYKKLIIKIQNNKVFKLIKYRKNFFFIKNYTIKKYTFFLIQPFIYYNNFKELKKKTKKQTKIINKIIKLSC